MSWKQRGFYRDGAWYSRGYLPHFDDAATTQFITTRLYDSLPQYVLSELRSEIQCAPHGQQAFLLNQKIESCIDRGYGQCFLAIPAVSQLVKESLLYFDGKRYLLHAWVIMPNHIHFLITLLEPIPLSRIVGDLKSFTSKAANDCLRRAGSFWCRDYFDRFIRNEQHMKAVEHYIEQNPVSAGLCAAAEDWPFSSASPS